MISIRKSIELTGGTAPYTYTWSSDDVAVGFSTPSGTTNTGVVNVDVLYPFKETIDSATITIAGVDSEGCSFSITVTVDNVCDALSASNMSITDQSDLVLTGTSQKAFSVVASNPNCSFVTYEWLYDDNLLTNVGNVGTGNRSTIILRLNESARSYPANVPVKVRITDCNNCFLEVTGQYNIETDFARDIMVDLAYSSLTGQYESGNIQIPGVIGSSNLTPRFSTTEFTLPGNFTATITDPVSGKVKFTTPDGTDAGLHVGVYTYQLSNGTWAYEGNIKLNVIAPERCKDLVTGDKSFVLDSTYSAGSTYTIPISSEIVLAAGEQIDWSTWQVLTPPASNSPSITLTTTGSGERAIAYVVPTPKVDDSFSWTVATTNGKWMCTAVYTIINGTNPPTVTNDSGEVQCDTPVIIDVLANDTSVGSQLDPATIIITSQPSYGTVSNPLDGTLIYTATNLGQTSDSFSYKVANTTGEYSGEATVSITIACAGDDASVSLCY